MAYIYIASASAYATIVKTIEIDYLYTSLVICLAELAP